MVTKKTKEGMKVNFPTIKTVTLGELKWPNLNRGEVENHITKMETTISTQGMMDLVKVFPKGIDGKYAVAEGNHRVAALLSMFGSDLELQVAVLDWKDESDMDEVQDTIIQMNTQNKVWTLYDYVRSHSQMAGKHNSDLYKRIRTDMVKLKKHLANGVVATIYDKSERTHKPMKLGVLEIKKSDQQYIDILKEFSEDVVIANGKQRCNGPFMRRFVAYLWDKADAWDDVMKFHRLLHECSNAIRYICSSNNTLPDGDETFKRWFEDMVNEVELKYNKSKSVEVELV